MAEAVFTPRISAQHLDQFALQTVRVTGKVIQLRGEEATIDANGHVVAHLNRDSHLTVGNAVELIAKVRQDLSLTVLQSTDMGTNLDFDIVNAVVDATHRYKEIFYGGKDM